MEQFIEILKEELDIEQALTKDTRLEEIDEWDEMAHSLKNKISQQLDAHPWK